MIIEKTFHEVYIHVLRHLLNNGILVAKSKMVENLTFTLSNPENSLINHAKNWNWALHEGLNRMAWEEPRLMNPGTAYMFRPNWKKKLEKEGGRFCYSYGERYFKQIPQILKALKSKSEREAILTMWDDDYLINRYVYKRRPCTIALHFYRYKDKLSCQCFMRTSDVMNMLPYDVFHHTLMQRYIATYLGIEMGFFHFTAGIAYYQKKRDVTGSVKNTLERLLAIDPPETTNNWYFSEEDRKNLVEIQHKMFILDKEEDALNQTLLLDSIYSKNYANAMLYYKYEKTKNGYSVQDLNEFEVIRL